MRARLFLLGLLASVSAVPQYGSEPTPDCPRRDVASWEENCHRCECTPGGYECKFVGCGQPAPPLPKRYCEDQLECSAGCDEKWNSENQCYDCQCGHFGDLKISKTEYCPDGLPEVTTSVDGKVCRGQGCTPGTRWTVNRGCQRCLCTERGEPACTPCLRNETSETRACGGHPRCPADVGRRYNPDRDCYDCIYGIGEPNDISVQIDQECPPGTDVRAYGWATKSCAPFNQLPQYSVRVCGEHFASLKCPERRFGLPCQLGDGLGTGSEKEGCIYCQCGPVLAFGDKVLESGEECQPPGVLQHSGDYKVCRAPTREACTSGTGSFKVDCDDCYCQDDGVPACTKRDCSLPEYLVRPPRDLPIANHDEQCPPNHVVKTKQSYGKVCAPVLPLKMPEDCVIADAQDSECFSCYCDSKPALFHTCQYKHCFEGWRRCPFGQNFVDNNNNICQCNVKGTYDCYQGVRKIGTSEIAEPQQCLGAERLPRIPGMRVYCLDGFVHVQDQGSKCVANSNFMADDYCNTCSCTPYGDAACSRLYCAQVPPPPAPCAHGEVYLDECGAECTCALDGSYTCEQLPSESACRPGEKSRQPMTCPQNTPRDLPRLQDKRVFCHLGVVQVQKSVESKDCLVGSQFLDPTYCRVCNCTPKGRISCNYNICTDTREWTDIQGRPTL